MAALSHELSLRKRKRRQSLTESVGDKIRRLIQEGYWPLGTRLPNEMEVAESLGVSRGTLRSALNTLVQEGLIIRRQGIGTFVTSNKPLLRNNLHINLGATEIIESMGLEPGCTYMKCEIVSAEDKTADLLDLTPGTNVIFLERVRTADGQPVVFCTDIFAEKLLGRMTVEERDIIKSCGLRE